MNSTTNGTANGTTNGTAKSTTNRAKSTPTKKNSAPNTSTKRPLSKNTTPNNTSVATSVKPAPAHRALPSAKAPSPKAVGRSARGAGYPAAGPPGPGAAPLHVDPSSPHVDGEPLVRAEQCIALLQRRLIKPMSRGGPNGELTLTQYHALSFLAARGQASVTELKEILGFAQSTTSVLVDKLQRQGLVEKQRDSHDQRVACVVPLPKGLRMVQRYRKNAERNLLALQAVLGDGAVRDVFDALERALVATAPLEDPRVARAAAEAPHTDDDAPAPDRARAAE